MFGNTEAVVLRQIKILEGRRMLLLFTKEHGKISAGTRLSEKGKGKSALLLQPFTYGRYQIRQLRNNYYLDGGEVIRSHYGIGQDPDKYAEACFALELTDKILPEEAPAEQLFGDLTAFLSALEQRKRDYRTLGLAYQAKAVAASGSGPQTDACVHCGAPDPRAAFSLREGGALCESCAAKASEALLYGGRFAIVDMLRFLERQPFDTLQRFALDAEACRLLQELLDRWMASYLDIGRLKSRALLDPETGR